MEEEIREEVNVHNERTPPRREGRERVSLRELRRQPREVIRQVLRDRPEPQESRESRQESARRLQQIRRIRDIEAQQIREARREMDRQQIREARLEPRYERDPRAMRGYQSREQPGKICWYPGFSELKQFPNKQLFINLLQKLKQKESFPRSKSEHYLNKLLNALNREDCDQDSFQLQVLTLLLDLQFESVVSEGPICRQKKTNLRYYRCFDCENSGIFACFCEECFEEQMHKQHTFKLYPNPSYCDCGDPTVLKTNSFCKKHRNFIQTTGLNPIQHSTFYNCLQFLFFLSFELNDISSRDKPYGKMLLRRILQKIMEVTQNSYEYKKVTVKLLCSPIRQPYLQSQKCILQSILQQRQTQERMTKLIYRLYDVPIYRGTLIQKYWNYHNCSKQFRDITHNQLIAYLLLSDVTTINKLLRQERISPIRFNKWRGQDQQQAGMFFKMHKIMRNHIGYAEYIELVFVQWQFQIEDSLVNFEGLDLQLEYSEYAINVVKALSKNGNMKPTLENIVKWSYGFIKSQRKKKKSERYRTVHAEIVFSLALFALYNFQLNLLEEDKLETLLSLLGQQTKLDVLAEQNYEILKQLSEKVDLFNALEDLDGILGRKICFKSFQFKIWLILQAKLQKALKYDMVQFKFGADYMNSSVDEKPLNFYINMMYVIEVDFYEVMVANQLGHSQVQKIAHFLQLFRFIVNTNNKKMLLRNFCDWIPNFQQLRFEGNSELFNLLQPQQPLFYSRVSYTSPFIPKQNKTILTSFFNLKRNNYTQRNQLSLHFFSNYLDQKMQFLAEDLHQRFKQVKFTSLPVIDYLNKWLKLCILLYLQTKSNTYIQIISNILQKFPTFIFNRQNKFQLYVKIMMDNICQENQQPPQTNLEQSPTKEEPKNTNEKKMKMMNKIKQMQQNYMKKINIDTTIEAKEYEHVCLVCKLPQNLIMLCNTNINSSLYSNLFGCKRSFLMINSCGHLVHQKCINPRMNRRYRYEQQAPLFYTCDLCKQQANMIMPFIEGQNINPHRFKDQLKYTDQQIKGIFDSSRQPNNNRNEKSSASSSLQSYQLDQLLFESVLFSVYFFFTSHSKFFIEKMFKVVKNVLAILQHKLRKTGLNIRPLNIHVKSTHFKYLEQMLALLIYHQTSARTQMMRQIEQKIEQLQQGDAENETVQLLKVVLWLLGNQKHKLSQKYTLENFNLFDLPKDLFDLQRMFNKCQTCKITSKTESPNLTNLIRICLLCGLKSCKKCHFASKSLHTHESFTYNLKCDVGTLHDFPLYTDEFGVGPQQTNRYALKVRGLYKLNQNNYQKVLNCLIASKEFIYRQPSVEEERWQRAQMLQNDQEQLIVMPRDSLQAHTASRYDAPEQYDWARDQRSRGRGQRRGPRMRGGFRRPMRGNRGFRGQRITVDDI